MGGLQPERAARIGHVSDIVEYGVGINREQQAIQLEEQPLPLRIIHRLKPATRSTPEPKRFQVPVMGLESSGRASKQECLNCLSCCLATFYPRTTLNIAAPVTPAMVADRPGQGGTLDAQALGCEHAKSQSGYCHEECRNMGGDIHRHTAKFRPTKALSLVPTEPPFSQSCDSQNLAPVRSVCPRRTRS